MNTSILKKLFERKFGKKADTLSALPLSGSVRRYFRLTNGESKAIGAFNSDVRENIAFIEFSKHFRSKGLNVPEIYCVSEDNLYYLEEDLGDTTLYDFANDVRVTQEIPPVLKELYLQALEELIKFQVIGHDSLD